MCGKNTTLVLGNIEGATVNVCSDCLKLGTRVNLPKQKTKRIADLEPEVFIVDNYSQLIKNARERKNMKQEEVAKKLALKESIVHKLENGSFTPSLNMASRIEKFFGIKLMEEYSESMASTDNKSESYTMADVIKG